MAPLIDIHIHVLPGVDDGSRDMEQSIEMMKIAYENGVRGMVVTPHFKPQRHNADPETVSRLMKELQRECLEREIKIRLYEGNEILYHSSVMEDLEKGRINTLAGSRYVLLEFSPADVYERIRQGLYSVLSYGYIPILAHTERYEAVCADIDRVEELTAMGCYIQINAGSVMGTFGGETKAVAKKLLKDHLVHFVASDAHDAEKRSPALYKCAEHIYKKYGADYEKELFSQNPAHVIKNEII